MNTRGPRSITPILTGDGTLSGRDLTPVPLAGQEDAAARGAFCAAHRARQMRPAAGPKIRLADKFPAVPGMPLPQVRL
jgi:hypothetical protein